MKRKFIILGLMVFAIYVLVTALVAIDVTETVIITQLGKPVRVVNQAGLTFKWPYPIQAVLRLDKRLRPLDSNVGEYLTQDKKNLVVSYFILWRMVDPMKFIESVKDITSAERRLSDLVGSGLGVTIGTYSLSDFVTTDQTGSRIPEIEEKVTKTGREQAVREFGIEVVDVRMRRLAFPEQNLRSVFARMRAERDRMAKKYRAEGEEQAAKIKAQTDKTTREILAKAYRESQVIRGQGEAEAMRIYAEAFEQDPEYYKLTRTLEAYRKFIDQNTTMILSAESPLFRYLEAPPVAP